MKEAMAEVGSDALQAAGAVLLHERRYKVHDRFQVVVRCGRNTLTVHRLGEGTLSNALFTIYPSEPYLPPQQFLAQRPHEVLQALEDAFDNLATADSAVEEYSVL